MYVIFNREHAKSKELEGTTMKEQKQKFAKLNTDLE